MITISDASSIIDSKLNVSELFSTITWLARIFSLGHISQVHWDWSEKG